MIEIQGITLHYVNIEDFQCKCSDPNCDGKHLTVDDIDADLLIRLEYMCTHAHSRYAITSGARCRKHNSSKLVRGASNSAHIIDRKMGVKCCAADGVLVKFKDPRRMAVEAALHGFNGIGWYDDGHGARLHLDTNKSRYSRWHDEGKGIVYEFTTHEIG